MANLMEIRESKELIANKLLTNETIINALIDGTDFNVDRDDVFYNIIFPYIYIDDTQTKAYSYICYEVNADSMDDQFWKNI